MNKNLLLKAGVALILDAGVAGYKGYTGLIYKTTGSASVTYTQLGQALAWSGIVSTLPAVAGHFVGSAVSEKLPLQVLSGVVAADALTCAFETEFVRNLPGLDKLDTATEKSVKANTSYVDFANTTLQVLAFDAIDHYFPAEDSTDSVLPEINA